MIKEYIVRADFYPNGMVMPLGLTDKEGITLYVEKVNEINIIGPREYKIDCIANKINFILVLKDNKWTCSML